MEQQKEQERQNQKRKEMVQTLRKSMRASRMENHDRLLEARKQQFREGIAEREQSIELKWRLEDE